MKCSYTKDIAIKIFSRLKMNGKPFIYAGANTNNYFGFHIAVDLSGET